jgi:hypothetical protein
MAFQTNIIFNKVKTYFLVFCLLSCYPLYSFGQMWLFVTDQQIDDFYQKITKHSADWINAHLILMLAIVLMIPAFLAINRYLKSVWSQISVFFISLSVFVLFGQFTIDLCLIEIFRLPEKQAYEVLENIQNNAVIKALFYDNSKLFFLFKFLDFALIAQITMGIALVKSNKIPKWALVIFFIALLLTFLGILFHPIYGRIIKRVSYSLFSVSFIPIAIALFQSSSKNNFKKSSQ